MKSSLTTASLLLAILTVSSCSDQSAKIDVQTTNENHIISVVSNSNNSAIKIENKNQNISETTTIDVNTNQNTPKVTIPDNLKITSCTSQAAEKYDFWNPILEKFYPTFVPEFHQECILSNNMKIVVASLFEDQNEQINSAKKVILFDQENKHLLSTTGLKCPNIGGPVAPKVDSLSNNTLQISCKGEGMFSYYEKYISVSMRDFSFTVTKYTVQLVDDTTKEVKNIDNLKNPQKGYE